MRNLWLVVRREFVERGRSSAYMASTIIMAVLLFGTTLAPAFLDKQSKTEPMHVLVLDQTGKVTAPLREAIKGAQAAAPQKRDITLEEATGDEESLTRRIVESDQALLVIEGKLPGELKARFYAAKPALLNTAGVVLMPLENLIRAARIQARGVDPAIAMEVLRPLEIVAKQATAKGDARSRDQFTGSVLTAISVVMLIYYISIMNGTFAFQGVLEEKVSRVMEVMASTVTAGQMLAGKVIGLGALGLLQFSAMALARVGGSYIGQQMLDMPSEPISASVAGLVIAYMMLGYLLTSTIMAAAAATISRMEDSQTVLMPISLLLAIPMFLLTAVMNDPNSPLSVTLSLIPFFSPTIMLMRVILGDVPAWQIVLSLSLMILTTLATVWAAARIYRAAMLVYGSRPTIKQMWGYLRAG